MQVSRWRDDKGFGFITPESGGEDIFVHQTVLNCSGFRALTMGEEVEYTTIPDGDRIKAGKASQSDAWRTPSILPPIVVSSTIVCPDRPDRLLAVLSSTEVASLSHWSLCVPCRAVPCRAVLCCAVHMTYHDVSH